MEIIYKQLSLENKCIINHINNTCKTGKASKNTIYILKIHF